MPRRLALTLAFALALAHPAHAFRHLNPGQEIPPPALTGVAGEPVRLRTDSRATVYLLWASWSPRSIQALADFERLSRIGSGCGLQVVAVNVDGEKPSAEDVARRTSVLQSADVSYFVAVDRELTLYEAWGTNAVPSAVLVDAAGKVLDVLDGYPPEGSEAFRHAVAAAVGAAPAGSVSAAGSAAAFALHQAPSANLER